MHVGECRQRWLMGPGLRLVHPCAASAENPGPGPCDGVWPRRPGQASRRKRQGERHFCTAKRKTHRSVNLPPPHFLTVPVRNPTTTPPSFSIFTTPLRTPARPSSGASGPNPNARSLDPLIGSFTRPPTPAEICSLFHNFAMGNLTFADCKSCPVTCRLSPFG